VMNDTNTANAYLKTKVLTASREELRLMLIDGAIKFAQQALSGLENEDHEQTYAGFSQCRDIILELINTIKPEHAPEIAKSVKDLYTYIYGELVKSSINKDQGIVREIISLLEYERETWVLTMERVVEERDAGIAPAQQLKPTGTYAESGAKPSISFQA
jgi:flagellar protein FliS